MDVDDLPVIEPDVEYTQILPLQQKRTIAFINNFVMNTVSFLNTFCKSCESRLMEFEYKLQKIEASLLILESQLSSISCLDNNDKPTTHHAPENSLDLPEVVPSDIEQTENNIHVIKQKEENIHDIEQSSNEGPKACDDPRFIRFFKMVQFGVPPAAVKQKMETEGLDPSVLDKPNEVIPGFSREQPNSSPTPSNST